MRNADPMLLHIGPCLRGIKLDSQRGFLEK
jgi:hypothetical protein